MKNFKDRFKSSKPKTKRFSKPLSQEADSKNITSHHSNTKVNGSSQPQSFNKTQPTTNQVSTIGINKIDTKPYSKIQPKLNIKLSNRINIYLLIFIFIYIVVEVIFNFILVYQMSYSATALDIQNIERTGKLVTGIGIALLMCKSLLNHANFKFKFFLKCFALFLALGITISFFLQTAIVNYVVSNATPEKQQRALLVTSATTTIVPFYDDKSDKNHITLSDRLLFPLYKAINSDSQYPTIYTKYQRVKNFNKTSRNCSLVAVDNYAGHYPISKSLDKAFFSYSHLIATDAYEALHKKAITNYYSCLFEDDVLVGMYAEDLQVLKDKVAEFYQEYLDKSEEYNAKLKQHPRYKDTIDEKWQSRTTDTLGFETTLPPNLSFEAFVKHPDVKTYMAKNQVIMMPYPYADDMASELKNSLPDFVLAKYLMAKKEGILEDESELVASEEDNKLSKITHFFKEPSLTDGKKAYKAVMMPMVALGFSVTFLILNIISLLSLILSDNSKKISTWFQRIATMIFFVLPFILHPPTPLIIPPNESMLLTIMIKFLYFYQNIVWTVQQFFI